jgi:hypothetical protein
MAVPVLLAGAMSISLARESGLHRLLALLQLGGYAAAAVGLFAPASRIGRLRPVALGSFFVMVNLASLHAAINVLRGKRIERWEPTRTGSNPGSVDR